MEKSEKEREMKINKAQIRWLINRLHVSTTEAEIEADLRRRASDPRWTEAKLKQAIAYAIKHHNHNRKIYLMVS